MGSNGIINMENNKQEEEEDESLLLSLVNDLTLNQGHHARIGSKSPSPTGSTLTITDLRSRNEGGPPFEVKSCKTHTNIPALFWCSECRVGVCQLCIQEHSGHFKSLQHLQSPVVSKLEAETLSLSKLVNQYYVNSSLAQDSTLALINALNNLKKELESELVRNEGVELSEILGELSCIQNILFKSRVGTGVEPTIVHAALLEATRRRAEVERLIAQQVGSTLHLTHHLRSTEGKGDPTTTALQLINTYTTLKLNRNLNTKLLKQPKQFTSRFYFDMEMIGGGSIGTLCLGRIIVETRPDLAPKMCMNFKSLVLGEKGVGYKGCAVFQCWKGESIITGDFEHNNGRGGYSTLHPQKETGLFLPEDTRLPATRGSIGMRRTQKRHDSKGLVGSQFRIILQDMPGFTGIFGYVKSGIEVVERISELGDSSGNPLKRVFISKCGAC